MQTLRCDSTYPIPLQFSDLPDERRLTVFSQAAGVEGPDLATSLRELSKITLVCKAWWTLQHDDTLWRPILNQYHLPAGMECIDKVRLFVKRLKEFKTGFIDGYRSSGLGLQPAYNDTPVVEFRGYVTKASEKESKEMRDLISILILEEKLESVAKILLFKPGFDRFAAAFNLFQLILNGDSDASFCFQMLIKSHVDLKPFFGDFFLNHVIGNSSREFFIWQVFLRQIEGLRLSDYLACGFDVSRFEVNTEDVQSNYSPVLDFLVIAIAGHGTEAFSEGGIEWIWENSRFVQTTFTPLSFTDEKLMEIRSKEPISELEVKQILQDLIFKGNLNLDIKVHLKPQLRTTFSALPDPVTVLSFFEACAHAPFLPKNNIIEQVWNEYRLSDTI
jgi:hypothetical protein